MRDMPKDTLSEEQIAMSIDYFARWLSRVTLAVAIIMIGWGLSVIFTQPVTAWFSASTMIWMSLLLISAIWQLRGSFPAIAALALATAVVSRLFSILRFNPPDSLAGLKPEDLDLLVASPTASTEKPEISLNESALAFIRVYVGLMFVPHFGSHILGGPFQFKVSTLYFESLGIHMPALQVALAGS